MSSRYSPAATGGTGAAQATLALAGLPRAARHRLGHLVTPLLMLATLLPLAARAQAPVNDDPLGAISLPLAATCTPTNATNAGATTTAPNGYTNPGCGIATAPKDVWFRFRTDATGPGSTAAGIAVTGTVAGQVRLFSSTGQAGPFSPVGCASGGSNNSQAARLVVVGLTPATTYYVAVSGYESTDAQGAFTICATVPAANDAAVESVLTLTQLPIPPGAPHLVRAVVSNQGSTAQTNLPVTLTVTGANPFTNTQTVAALAPGASATVSFVGFTPVAAGTNTLAVTVPADDETANNSRSVTQEVNTTTYSYADPGGANPGGFGMGTITNMAFACRYSVSTPVSVTQVRPYIVNSGGASGPASSIGKTVFGVVVDPATGTLLARSADYVLTAADINTYVTLPLTLQVALPAGTDVLVGVAPVLPGAQTVGYYPLGVQNDGPGRTNTFYYVSTASLSLPAPLSSNTGGYKRLMIEAVIAPATPCAPVTALAAGSLTPSSAVLTFAGAPATITYTTSDGTPTTVPATASPATLPGLLPGTTYTVSVSASCGANASFPASVTFTTPPAVAPYAALPYAESFEGPWLSAAAVRDAPTTNWRNTPSTGDRSWRRDDDGSAANWTSSQGAYAPAGSQGSRSARFHSAVAGNTGSPLTGALDLYVNLSAPGTKTLTFDYINPDGTDLLRVLVSTDGGATFGGPVAGIGVSPTFSARTVNLTSTSATTVIRFQATKDFGLSDLGLDNVRIAVVTGTRNEALAATVGLYPNPAHRSFALAVPAGPLGAASATLRNALGQVVQVRPLGLPAAGGTTEFDVRGLAAGVYTLQLQTGETLVVKRVVLE